MEDGTSFNSEPTLVEQAFAALRKDIIDGTRAPGERLRIDKLRSLYGIGASPLREALQRLAADGFVIASSNRGFLVAPLNPTEFEDLNTARIAVECAALRLSVVAGDEDWEAQVVAAAYSLEKLDRQLIDGTLQDFDRWEVLNAKFHTTLVSACGSRWLLRHRDMLQIQCERYRRASVYHARLKRDLLTEHSALAKAALARDVELVCRLTQEHYAKTANHLLVDASAD
ncbi:GntR family transcriptional regulator [Roseibaca sp. Y0-43]|uniref:GntR family transcriptional regulator n=1 Tax=Roseibaca sp. Y0-43 TaxID=2816854 RepID=UPI001D0C55D7|nr:FCD domain-containing protein [Roseibaca sp. Y0-43]MCC1481156.1 FCD domain-containing protein [Roseibaca sp. Y0-43]